MKRELKEVNQVPWITKTFLIARPIPMKRELKVEVNVGNDNAN